MNTTVQDYAHSQSLAGIINVAYAKGELVTVNGREVFAPWGKPAIVFGNGTLGVEVRQKSNPHRSTVLYAKVEQTIHLTHAQKG